MRRLFPAAAVLLAACGSNTPSPKSTPVPVMTTALPPSVHQHNDLNGMSANELVQHLGSPVLQVREGNGTKLQFASRSCVLDAFLYPPASGGLPRVTFISARDRQGHEVPHSGCIATIEAR